MMVWAPVYTGRQEVQNIYLVRFGTKKNDQVRVRYMALSKLSICQYSCGFSRFVILSLLKSPPNKPKNKTSLSSSWSWPRGHGYCLESLLSATVAKSGSQGKHRPLSFIPLSSRKCSPMVCLPLRGPLLASSLCNMKPICQEAGQGHNTRAIWQKSGCYLQAKQILLSLLGISLKLFQKCLKKPGFSLWLGYWGFLFVCLFVFLSHLELLN